MHGKGVKGEPGIIRGEEGEKKNKKHEVCKAILTARTTEREKGDCTSHVAWRKGKIVKQKGKKSQMAFPNAKLSRVHLAILFQ